MGELARRGPSLAGSPDETRVVHNQGVERVEHVTAWIYREGDGYVALCPELDIASQGDNIEDARRNIEEAVALFFETASEGEIQERFQREFYVTPLDVKVG
jgi:predicted RNase H-like HicB family nuclease